MRYQSQKIKVHRYVLVYINAASTDVYIRPSNANHCSNSEDFSTVCQFRHNSTHYRVLSTCTVYTVRFVPDSCMTWKMLAIHPSAQSTLFGHRYQSFDFHMG